MKYSTKRIASRAFLIYAAVNAFTYVFAHVAYLFANDVIGEIFEYVSFYLSKSVEFLAPPIIAAIAFLIYGAEGKRASFRFTLAVSSARALYALPYYYIIFVNNYAYDSLEAILLSLLATLLIIILTCLGALISIAVCILVLKRIAKHSGKNIKDELPAAPARAPISDFLAEDNLPALTFALLRFGFSLITELIDTVSFFIEYRSDYTSEEIITILASFTLLFCLLVLSYLVASKVRNALIGDSESVKSSEQ